MAETQTAPPQIPTEQQFPEQAQQIPTGLQGDMQPPDDGVVRWTASEFISHDKSSSWYLGLFVVAVLIIGGIFLITRDIFSVIALSVGALLFGVYASREPRQLEYSLDETGVGIGQKHYTYDQFRSFAIIEEGAFSSIIFMPLKRFAPPLSIYYAPEDEERVLATLGNQLPFDQHKLDLTERLMRRIRF